MINFSNFKYTKSQYSINKKIIFIIILAVSLIYFAFIAYIQAKQFKLLLSLKEDFHELDQYISGQKYIFDKKIALNKKLKELENKKTILFSTMFNIKNVLNIILQNIPKDCCMDELVYNKNKINIKGKSRSWSSLNNFSTTLTKNIGKIIKHKQHMVKELIVYDLELLL